VSDPAGWIPAYRRLFEPGNSLAPTKRDPASHVHAWLDLCQMATWQPRETLHSGTLQRGELVVSLRTLADRWKWNYLKVRRFIAVIQECRKIDTLRETPDGTVYRIVSYDTYAIGGDDERNSERNRDETAMKQEVEVKKETRKKKPLPEVVEVFEYWASERKRILNLNGGPPPVLSASRSSKINARLGEGYDVATLKRAVDGCLASDFHVEGGHTDIELICRDQKHVEQFLIRLGQSQNGNGQHANPKARGRL